MGGLIRGRLAGLLLLGLLGSACDDGRAADFPPGLRAPDAQARVRAAGRALYQAQGCALCHGEHADGRGVRRTALSAPPQDFTNPAWRRGTAPREVFTVIREGKAGTSMPSWSHLSDEETWNLVVYLFSVADP